MSPDDLAALAKLEDDLARVGLAAITGANAGMFGARVPWLCRLARDLHARVGELEKGAVDDVLAKKNAQLAERDAAAVTLVAEIARLEALKLPAPADVFRKNPPKTVIDSLLPDDTLAVASGDTQSEAV